MPLRQPNSDNSARSTPHRKVEELLRELKLYFESEYSFQPYTVDIYIPEWHIAVEIDGPYHTKHKDEARDNYLLDQFGLYVLRLPVKEGLDKETVESRLFAFIDEHYNDSDTRRKTWLTHLSNV